jgi:hypothetical protein
LRDLCPVTKVRISHPVFCRLAGENRHPQVFEIPGFRVALPRTGDPGLPGMTFVLRCEFLERHT